VRCATGSVNPSRAHADTGYVDFHADSTNELNWQVARFDDRTQNLEVKNGMITPVLVALVAAGTAQVQSKEMRLRNDGQGLFRPQDQSRQR
jgi:hypothetical protein